MLFSFRFFLVNILLKRIGRNGHKRATYYNPTWQLYIKKSFPGTIYYPRPSGASYDGLEFHFLDQVIMSQKLMEDIVDEKIDTISETPNFSFLDKKSNRVAVSDHLPLIFEFKL
jgi:hypothetical protein